MKLLWSDVASADLDDIYTYISRDVPYYADMVANRLIGTTEKLIEHPYIGRMVPELGYRKDVREIIVHGYRIIYIVTVDAIQILTVIHGSKNPEWNNML